VPRILGLKYTNAIAELKMQFCGESLQSFINKPAYQQFSPYKKACLAFDMMRQLAIPLECLHRAKYVHGDIKPDNICISRLHASKIEEESKEASPYQSEYQFTLIDFGIISKFKIKKASRKYNSHVGNLMFASQRGLNMLQSRFQDDVEALVYVMHMMIAGKLPWDVEFRKRAKDFYGNQLKTLKLFTNVRIEMFDKFNEFICHHFLTLVPMNEVYKMEVKDDKTNPFRKIFHYLNLTNFQ
jgi:serine/threonine protein kinase